MSEEKKQKKVQYISKYLRLRIVLQPAYNTEVGGRVTTAPGKSVRFEDGFYETDDKGIIESLESRSDFGKVFIRVPEASNAKAELEDWQKDLEQREAEIKAREDAIAKGEVQVQPDEQGAAEGDATGPETDDLDELDRTALIKLAKKEKVAIAQRDNKDVLKGKIRAAREGSDEPAYE